MEVWELHECSGGGAYLNEQWKDLMMKLCKTQSKSTCAEQLGKNRRNNQYLLQYSQWQLLVIFGE